MNKWSHALITGVLVLLTPLTQAAPQELDRVIAVVNDGVVLQSDMAAMRRTVTLNAANSDRELPPQDVLEEQMRERLVIEELQLQEAKRLGIQIDDSQLQQAIENIAKEQSVSVQALREKMAEQGVAWAQYREQVRRELTISEARNAQVRRRISILPQEVETLASQLNEQKMQKVKYKLSHIQLKLDDDASKAERESVKKQAHRLVDTLRHDGDIAELAMEYSKGPKALDGGDWGWLRREEMPTIFADQITNQGKGAIIGPFRSGVGFHILKIDDVQGLETVAVTEVKARHILIKPSIVLSDKGAQKELNQLTDQIRRGEQSFADLAKQYSDDPGSAVNGGDLGWSTTDAYVPAFKAKVDALPKGQVSEPFKTVHGWHIVEVTDRREVDKTDAAVKNRAYRMLFNRKFNEEAQAWLQELRAGAYVEVITDDS
ncbi:peptidylprolyl isomerase SurA [Salinivibrio kushneri]|uniref:peptidylprolyl isomerase SurA n=1 Tax=Salinivibrio kushneri TaxID=1908198 RepID=UPI000987C6F2|nr:peptidylprolyl isomerase SurA [Salinivibrio kushneri]OOE53143.1 peptidylprolyl isomerase SurA [Salinivibrio kushneri]OOE55087.1 peptidylprolyl isomerase SurA [Salinivibrio kushneri]OOE61858.1 peptidylprolyl isomerase SurA [Salinivibrio kushneri]